VPIPNHESFFAFILASFFLCGKINLSLKPDIIVSFLEHGTICDLSRKAQEVLVISVSSVRVERQLQQPHQNSFRGLQAAQLSIKCTWQLTNKGIIMSYVDNCIVIRMSFLIKTSTLAYLVYRAA